MTFFIIPTLAFGLVIAGCASMEPSEKPKGAFEMLGIVVDTSVVPDSGPSRAQQAAAGVVGAVAMSRIENSLQAKSITVRVTERLSLSVPTRQTMAPGSCVLLSIDPIYRQLISDAAAGTMSMPVGSTLIEARPCR